MEELSGALVVGGLTNVEHVDTKKQVVELEQWSVSRWGFRSAHHRSLWSLTFSRTKNWFEHMTFEGKKFAIVWTLSFFEFQQFGILWLFGASLPCEFLREPCWILWINVDNVDGKNQRNDGRNLSKYGALRWFRRQMKIFNLDHFAASLWHLRPATCCVQPSLLYGWNTWTRMLR